MSAEKLTTVYDSLGQAHDVSAVRAEVLLGRTGWSDTEPVVEDEGTPEGEPKTPAEKPTTPKK